jgi:fibronectin type 3 domain-containing protein
MERSNVAPGRVAYAAIACVAVLLVGPAAARAQGPPAAPVNLQAEFDAGQVHLTWDRGTGNNRREPVRYRIYRDGTPIGTSVVQQFDDPDVVAGTEYAYQVAGVDIFDREGDLSAPVSITIPDDTPPTRPEDLTAEAVSSSRIDLRWSAATDAESGVAGYYVYRNGESLPYASTTAPEYSDTGLAPFTEYEYRVSAVNPTGAESEKSDPATARTSDGSPPGAPADLTAEATSPGQISLTWSAAEDPESGIALYLVYRDGGEQPIDSTTATSYDDLSVAPATAYVYRVSARNGAGLEGAPSDEAKVTTPAAGDQTPPTAPRDFSATATGPGRVELSWTNADDPESGVSYYRVYRDGTVLGTSPGGGFTDLTVEPASSYAYEVTAVNGDGLEGPATASVRVTTPEAEDTVPPAPPTDLRIVDG